MPPTDISGIHHVTAIAGDPQRNLDFYVGTLGLRFVKRTVNFDDRTTYHLYYGDAVGTPGTALTFFPFGDGPRGRTGAGQASTTAFRVPADSLGFWRDRLADRGVDIRADERFGDPVLGFADPDGLELELVATGGPEAVDPWDGVVPADHAVRGFHGVTLASADREGTADLLAFLGYERTAAEGDRARYRTDGHAGVVDLVERSQRGVQGTGTVHHVAFRVADDDEQADWREALTDRGLHVTPQKDRNYFRSVYFREPGGVLFEFATEGPGFTRDEDPADLGTELKLPPWLEEARGTIEAHLPPLDTPGATDPPETTEPGA